MNAAFGQAASQKSRTLLVYSDVVSSNIVGDSEQPLICEVHYQQDGSGPDSWLSSQEEGGRFNSGGDNRNKKADTPGRKHHHRHVWR